MTGPAPARTPEPMSDRELVALLVAMPTAVVAAGVALAAIVLLVGGGVVRGGEIGEPVDVSRPLVVAVVASAGIAAAAVAVVARILRRTARRFPA
ncbi:hypothetical protein [Amnibacterium setariae]|uniref:hypothetical protein n=1 Tax=Amnibacterium setariae TaxID=2306585 RepID=UPI0011C4259D|nr:hypothetical protein [Amnibacterium setariae]